MSNLSEEEKKAIEYVKYMFEGITIKSLNKDSKMTIYSLGIADILLFINAFEKQQKEIEELKETVEFVTSHYISKDKIIELVAKHKLEYEEQWCSDGTYYKFAKDVIELLEE